MPRLELVAAPAAHTEPAWAVAWNPKRNILASCSSDKTVRLYTFTLPPPPPPSAAAATASSTSTSHTHASGQACTHTHAAASLALPSPTSTKPSVHFQQSIQTEHKRTVRTISWSPTGLTLATGSFDSTVGLWAEVDPDAEEEGSGEGVYRPEGAGAAGGGAVGGGEDSEDMDMDADVEMEQGTEGREREWECVTTLEGHESECKAVAWSSDGALLASCSRDKSVWVWELQPDSDFECIAVMMEHTQDVKHLAWHPHEEILASASYDSHINLQWDDPDGDWCLFQKTHPKLAPASLHISKPAPDANASALASFSALSAAILPTEEEKEAQEHLQVPPLLEDETVWSLAFSPCGMFMASGGDLGGIRIWARTGPNPDSQWAEVLHTAAHSRSIFSLSWTGTTSGSSPDPSLQSLGLLASGAGDGKIIVLELFKVAPVPPAVDGNSEDIATPAKKGRDIPRVKAVPVAAVRDAHGVADVNCVSWLERDDGRGAGVLASCADDGSVKVWRVTADE